MGNQADSTMAYDEEQGVIVIFGGEEDIVVDGDSIATNWIWNGEEWVQE